MKNFIGDFLKIFADSTTVICLVMAAFIFLLNAYHYRETNMPIAKNFSSDTQYVRYKTALSNAEKNFKSIDLNKVAGNKIGDATTAKNVYLDCSTALGKSEFNKLDTKESFSINDIYKYNIEMYEDLSNKCLFNIRYNYNIIDKNINLNKKTFSNLSDHIEESRINIMAATDYMISEMESNSSYYFMTDLTRNSVFNRNNENITFTVRNYLILAQELENISKWYVSEFGGAK